MTSAIFEWDSKKDQENQQKHGVSFGLAQYVFADSQHIIAEDLNHSKLKSVTIVLARSEMAFSRYALRIGTM